MKWPADYSGKLGNDALARSAPAESSPLRPDHPSHRPSNSVGVSLTHLLTAQLRPTCLSVPGTAEAELRACTLSLAAATTGGAVDVDATADNALGPAPLARWISLLGLAPSTAVSSLHAFSWVNQSVRCSSLRNQMRLVSCCVGSALR